MSQILVNLSFLFSRPTGISTYAINLFPYLQALNPTLLSAQNYEDFSCHLIPDNLTPAQGSKGHLRRLLWTQFQIPKIYQQLQSKLLFSPVPEAPIYSKCRYVVTVHDLIPLRFPKSTSPLTLYNRYYLPLVLQQAEHIICDSQATAQDLNQFFQISPQKITSIMLAYDADNFRDLNLETKPYFFYIGRHDPYKNLSRMIQAFAAIPNCQDYQFWIAGSADARFTPELQRQVKELGLEKQVRFLDYISYQQLPIIMNQALALVFTTLWEGFGLPVLEAMACGTPVITSNISSLPEVAGDAAILVNPYNVSEISAAMGSIIEEEQLRSHLSLLGKQRASQFSWQKTGAATQEVLQQFL